jgi:hypothetical protein
MSSRQAPSARRAYRHVDRGRRQKESEQDAGERSGGVAGARRGLLARRRGELVGCGRRDAAESDKRRGGQERQDHDADNDDRDRCGDSTHGDALAGETAWIRQPLAREIDEELVKLAERPAGEGEGKALVELVRLESPFQRGTVKPFGDVFTVGVGRPPGGAILTCRAGFRHRSTPPQWALAAAVISAMVI